MVCVSLLQFPIFEFSEQSSDFKIDLPLPEYVTYSLHAWNLPGKSLDQKYKVAQCIYNNIQQLETFSIPS